ncbi:MAG: spermidine synthase, partial [Bacteroidetes bacterium]
MTILNQQNPSNILKIALFATGLAGIVAEYVLSTLASYFLGDSVVQWTMILSTMLFSMGLGSRISKFITKNLLEHLIFIEFTLSILTSLSSLYVYALAAYTDYVGFFIYLLGALVGLLIGLEIPLVTRINEDYESLRVNIAAVMEKDYYGSLVGGAFFAFVGLPYLGITYTPFVLGSLNFLVAVWLYISLRKLVFPSTIKWINISLFFVTVMLVSGLIFAKPIVLYGEQKKYKDQVIFVQQSAYQKIVVTQWKNNYWLFINGNQQLCTLDEHLYHEPLVLPAMELAQRAENVLVLGGGDGCAVREVLKYSSVQKITLVDLDPMMTDLGKNDPIFVAFNKNSMNDPKVKIFNQDGFQFLEQTEDFYDVIIVDLPDPKSI